MPSRGFVSTIAHTPAHDMPTPVEVALCRATVADRATGPGECADLIGMLGLTIAEAGPRIRLAALDWRPDLNLRRRDGAPPATAPDTAAQKKARAAARRRRREAARDRLRALGWHPAQIRAALAGMDGEGRG